MAETWWDEQQDLQRQAVGPALAPAAAPAAELAAGQPAADAARPSEPGDAVLEGRTSGPPEAYRPPQLVPPPPEMSSGELRISSSTSSFHEQLAPLTSLAPTLEAAALLEERLGLASIQRRRQQLKVANARAADVRQLEERMARRPDDPRSGRFRGGRANTAGRKFVPKRPGEMELWSKPEPPPQDAISGLAEHVDEHVEGWLMSKDQAKQGAEDHRERTHHFLTQGREYLTPRGAANGSKVQFNGLQAQLASAEHKHRIPVKWVREIKRAHKDLLFIRAVRLRNEDRHQAHTNANMSRVAAASGRLRAASARFGMEALVGQSYATKKLVNLPGVPKPPPGLSAGGGGNTPRYARATTSSATKYSTWASARDSAPPAAMQSWAMRC